MIATSFNPSMENSRAKPQHRTSSTALRSNGMNRVFAAAIVSQQFCDMLLKDPKEALKTGYLGETFVLTPEEVSLIASIRADSLAEFARELYVLTGTD